jgi:sugar lactone lactonase YvrE
MDDLKLRDRLAALADDVPPQTAAPAGLVRRARRRAALVAGAIVVCLALVSVGLTAGVRTFLRSEGTRPADAPSTHNLAPGTIVTVVGSGEPGAEGVGGPAHEAELSVPIDIAFDPEGNMYIAERFGYRILKVDEAGILTVAAGGDVGFSGDGGLAADAELSGASAVAVDPRGNLYIADVYNGRIRMVDRNGIITTVAGTGKDDFSGDGGPATEARLDYPLGMAFDAEGNLYFQDTGNYVVRRVDRSGTITTIAGTGRLGPPAPDGTPAATAPLGPSSNYQPMGLEFDHAGRLLITDLGHARISMIDERGRLRTVAGNGTNVVSGDGGPATEAGLGLPLDIAVGPDGSLYIARYEHGLQGGSVRRVDPNGIITTIAGTGEGGYSGDGGPATAAELNVPSAVAIGPDGNLYIADAINNVIRMVVL